MGKLAGDGKQKAFFRIISAGLLLGCAYLIAMPNGHAEQRGYPSTTVETVRTVQEDKEDIQEKPIEPTDGGLSEDNNSKSTESTTINKQANEAESVDTISGEAGNEEAMEATSHAIANEPVKGIYVTGPVAGSKKMEQLIHLVDTTPLNTMVIDIKNDGGEVTYKMDYELASQIGATKNYISDMEALVKRLKEKNIYLIARIVVFKDPILAEQMPEYSIHNKDGSLFRNRQGLAWVNPYEKEVWKYVLNIAVRAHQLGFDEIQFDYIRFPTDKGLSNVDYGPESSLQTKQQVITQFTKCASRILRERNIKVSADVFGGVISSEVDSELIGQDYVEMAEALDCISPMIYPSQFAKGCYGVENPDHSPYDIVYKSMMDSKTKLEGKQNVTVRPWLQDFTASWLSDHISYDEKEIRAQIDAVYASGYNEWILWNAGNNYTAGGIH